MSGWVGNWVYVDGDNVWGVDHDGETVWLGKVQDVIPYLKGIAELPKDFLAKQQQLLQEIKEEELDGEIGEPARRSNLPRNSRLRATRSR